MSRRRLLLVSPDNPRLFSRARIRRFPALGLPIIAALTPEDRHDVALIDEGWGDRIPWRERFDLVGIGAMTSQAPRAYELADRFRRRGATVVLGGSHASVCPDEALEHADAVVIGEAERSWPRLLEDLARGRLRRRYRSSHPARGWYVPPRRDLVRGDVSIGVRPVLASRGCPRSCTFCSVHHVFGREPRRRGVDAVATEIEQLALQGARSLIFLDDNLLGDPAWARQLLRRLRPLGLRWGGQCTVDAARDPELLRLAARAGCIAMYVGLESVNRPTLREVRKGFNRIERYRDWCSRFHDNGIVLLAGIVFGFDHDDRHVFELSVEVLDRIGIGLPQFTLLIPLPGTALYERMRAEGRLLTHDWSRYTGSEVVFVPRRMSPEQLQAGSDWADFAYYTPGGIARRMAHNWRHPLFYLALAGSYAVKCHEHSRGAAIHADPAALSRRLRQLGL